MKFSDKVRPIKLSREVPQAGDTVLISGYGRIKVSKKKFKYLNSVNNTIITILI